MLPSLLRWLLIHKYAFTKKMVIDKKNNPMDNLKSIIIEHEGLKLFPYNDTGGKLTIGVGRNLTDVGISSLEASMMLNNDINKCKSQLIGFVWYEKLDPIRQDVLIELTFNIGIHNVINFNQMIENICLNNFKAASECLLESEWSRQVGANRANNMAHRLETGTYE